MKARTLRATFIEGVEYGPDVVLDLPPRLCEALTHGGAVDPHPEAVAYCERDLGRVAIRIGGDAPEADESVTAVESATDRPQRRRR